jgi:3-dehydroquinate synthase
VRTVTGNKATQYSHAASPLFFIPRHIVAEYPTVLQSLVALLELRSVARGLTHLCRESHHRPTQPTMPTVPVKLGSRSYEILIAAGLLDELGDRARTSLGSHCRRAIVVSNITVGSIYGERTAKSLKRSGFKVHSFSIGDGERFKSLRTAESLFGFLIEHGVERSDVIVALGGGVVGDLAGFVSATYLRGIRLIQVPTTLLAQIDSSVGGKTAVNHALGKNLIGAFHQPSLVLIDPDVLATLPARQTQAGLYEAIKYGVILDRRLFNRISDNIDRLKSLDSTELEHLIARCCALKARVVERDERESGLRKILNFGHTVGHALEAVTRYRRFLHGEAVGHGMRAASRIAERLGLLTEDGRKSIDATIASVGRLPIAGTLALDDIISAIHRDKKVEAGRATFVLPVEIGKVVMRSDAPPTVIRAALKDALK